MSAPADFLTSTAQAIATMTLYKDGHPAREHAVDRAYGYLLDLQDEEVYGVFTFLGGEIVWGRQPLRELKHWDWGERLAAAGIQRLEFVDAVTRDDFDAFLGEVFERLSPEPVSTAEVRQGRPSNIRYGEVGVRGESKKSVEGESPQIVTAKLGYSLGEEIEGVRWMHGELKEDRQLQLLEVESIVSSLSVAMHGDQDYVIPLMQMKDFDQYTVTHTMNVAVLTMALAEFLGLSPKEVRAFGTAGLLHDLGKVKIPPDILNKPGKLTDEERAVINKHPADGARIILETEENLDLAAVVAYEHHIRIDGGGYPSMTYQRACHQASNLVHVCDVFDALRTNRPYREAWPTERAIGIIEEGAGPEFDQEIATAFVQMMRRWEGRVANVAHDDPEVRFEDLESMGEDPDSPASDAGDTSPESGEAPVDDPTGE